MACGPAQVLRLALVYALADEADHIDVPHLQAARAVWEYHWQSVLHIFGAKLGDPVADRLLAAVRSAGPDGLDGTAQYAAFDNNVPKEALKRAVPLLEAGIGGRVSLRSIWTVRRPQENRPSATVDPQQREFPFHTRDSGPTHAHHLRRSGQTQNRTTFSATPYGALPRSVLQVWPRIGRCLFR